MSFKSIAFTLAIIALTFSPAKTLDKELPPPSRKRTLILIDNLLLHTTHSRFFADLKAAGHTVTIKLAREDAISAGHIRLQKDKAYLYDNLILMCTSMVDIPVVKTFNIKKFFDDGNNVFFMADLDISSYFRKLANEFGFKFAAQGEYLIDYKNALKRTSPNVFKVRQFRDISFLAEGVEGDLVFNGIGLGVTHFDNQQITVFARGNMHTAAISYNENKAKVYGKMGKHNVLVLGVQGFDNARVVVSGSLDLFSNELYEKSGGANRQFGLNLVDWLAGVRGVVKQVGYEHSCIDKNGNDSDCPVRCDFRFSIDVSRRKKSLISF